MRTFIWVMFICQILQFILNLVQLGSPNPEYDKKLQYGTQIVIGIGLGIWEAILLFG